MLRRICLALAASLSLAAFNLASGQDAQNNEPRSPQLLLAQQDVASTTPAAGNDVAKLQAENAALKKEVADAAHTIAQLQAKLAQAGSQPAATAGTPAQVVDTAAAAPAPTGPLKALPLDATNAVVNPSAPGSPATDAGPSRTYTVVKGDSIWKIAHKMYPGDTKNGVDKIQEANKDAIGGKPLKIGQVLVIPQ